MEVKVLKLKDFFSLSEMEQGSNRTAIGILQWMIFD